MMKKTLLLILMALILCIAMVFTLTGCDWFGKDSEHTGDNACEHVYDDCADIECNECGEKRDSMHTWADADCNNPKTCKVCGKTEGEPLGHKPSDDDGDCTTAITCSACGVITTPARDNHTGGTATCTEKAVCEMCGASYGELNSVNHIFVDGVCACGKLEPIDATAMTANELKAAVADKLAAGETDITVTLKPDVPAAMFTAIRRALIDTEGVADGSINLTLGGVTAIPAHSHDARDASIIFGVVQQDENGEFLDEIVTQLASVNLPDVLTIGEWAFSDCQKLTSLTAPKVQTVGKYAFYNAGLTSVNLPEATTIESTAFFYCTNITEFNFPKATVLDKQALDTYDSEMTIYLTSADEIVVHKECFYWVEINKILDTEVSLILNSNKQSQVNRNTWTTKDADGRIVSLTFRDIQFMCSNGTVEHSYESLTKNGDGTHTFACTTCNVIITEGCRGGEATCSELATCVVCGEKYGELSEHVLDSATGFCKFGCETAMATFKIEDSANLIYHKDMRNFSNQKLTDGSVVTLLADESNFGWGVKGDYTLDLNGYDLTSPRYSVYAGCFEENAKMGIVNSADERSAIPFIRVNNITLKIGSKVDVAAMILFYNVCIVDLTDADFESCILTLNLDGCNVSQFILGNYAIYDAADNIVTGELDKAVTYTIKAAQ